MEYKKLYLDDIRTPKTEGWEILRSYDDFVSWIEKSAVKDGQNHIKINVEKQIEAVKSSQSVAPPWMPQIYTPGQ